MNTVIVGHRSGEFVVPDTMVKEIRTIFKDLYINLKKFMVKELNEIVPTRLKAVGWSDNVRLGDHSKINITSMKDNIGLCMQTGNVSRIYADLLKLQALYLRGSIKASIIIIPTSKAAKAIGGNVASLERLQRELPIFYQVITMPLVIIGFYD